MLEEIFNFVHKEEEPYFNTEKKFPSHKKNKQKKTLNFLLKIHLYTVVNNFFLFKSAKLDRKLN